MKKVLLLLAMFTTSALLVLGILFASSPANAQSLPEGCDLLPELTVEPEGIRDGYDRDLFGDYDRDAVLAAGESDGTYYSLFDDETHDADGVDVDHVVALAEAWDSGASDWDEATRDEFGGDADNLILLTSSVNRQDKSDSDAGEWWPTNADAYEEFAAIVVGVKHEYGLTVDDVEYAALEALCAGDSPVAVADGADEGADEEVDDTLPVTGFEVWHLLTLGIGIVVVGALALTIKKRSRLN